MRVLWCILILLGALGSGCAGYRVGPVNGQAAGAKSIHVALFENQTFEPRLTEPVGSALRRILQQDATYRLSSRQDADVVVTGAIIDYRRSGISFQPRDVITPRDFQIRMEAKVTAIERQTGRVLLDRTVGGRTTIRMGDDLASAERQAVPVLAEDLARNVATLLTEGPWW